MSRTSERLKALAANKKTNVRNVGRSLLLSKLLPDDEEEKRRKKSNK